VRDLEGASVILEVPVEIIDVVFRVEKANPIKPIIDVVKSVKKVDSDSQSVHRLDAISRTTSSLVKVKEFPTQVIRDLWKGKYWGMKERNLSLGEDVVGSIHRLDTSINKINVNETDGEVRDLASPFLGWLAHESEIPRNKILSHVRLKSLKSRNEIVFLRTRVTQKRDSAGRKHWIHDEGPFKGLIVKHIDKISGFEVNETESTEETYEWPYSPEIQSLYEFKKNPDEKKVLRILESILDQVKQDNRPRLDWVKQVVGFRQDMWDATQEVIRSSKEQAFILTSFSNPRFSDNVAELLAEASDDSHPEIMISFGEPDRGRSPEDIQNTEQYISTIAKDKRFKLKGGISPKSSHAKVVISDTGMVFLCSCNLFSGSLESGVLESGLLIKDVQCAKSILEATMEEGWIPSEVEMNINKIYSDLGKIKQPTFALMEFVEEKIAEIKSDIKEGNEWYAYAKLERMLRDIAEKPVWSLIRTLEHRPFMADCIERFDKRIVMASDGLRSNGLDKATIRRIANRASKNKAVVHIWWGRHAPKSKPFDAVDQRGREEAKKQLQQLRQTDGSSKGTKGRINQIHEKGFGFLRTVGKGGKRVFISPKFVNKHNLKSGDSVEFIQKNAKGKKNPEVEKFTKVRDESLSPKKHKLNFHFCPMVSNEPMETHAKMFIVDDYRLMITSDNTLSFGDTEAERGDAGELGIIIDHPRLAVQTRGSMDLWLPKEARLAGDWTRWWALLGEEVSLLTNNPSEKIPLINALDSVIERMESIDYLRDTWEEQVEVGLDELEIVNKLAFGCKFGIYCIAKSRDAKGIKSKLSMDQIRNAVISLGGESAWQDSN